jgi:hypothetical protein
VRDKAYWAPFVTLPVIITEPGEYITRGGEKVIVESVSTKHDFDCLGTYSTGQSEGWHKSGRLFAGRTSQNDIVSKA